MPVSESLFPPRLLSIYCIPTCPRGGCPPRLALSLGRCGKAGAGPASWGRRNTTAAPPGPLLPSCAHPAEGPPLPPLHCPRPPPCPPQHTPHPVSLSTCLRGEGWSHRALAVGHPRLPHTSLPCTHSPGFCPDLPGSGPEASPGRPRPPSSVPPPSLGPRAHPVWPSPPCPSSGHPLPHLTQQQCGFYSGSVLWFAVSSRTGGRAGVSGLEGGRGPRVDRDPHSQSLRGGGALRPTSGVERGWCLGDTAAQSTWAVAAPAARTVALTPRSAKPGAGPGAGPRLPGKGGSSCPPGAPARTHGVC